MGHEGHEMMQTILFIDDNRNLREFWKRELESNGYRVFLGGSGTDALETIRKTQPDLIVLDIRMPRMDGFDAIARIMEETQSIPVIFYTAHSGDLDDDYRSWLARDWIEKSGDPEQLKTAIARALEPSA